MMSEQTDREVLAETTARIVSTFAPIGDLEKVVRTDVGYDQSVWQRLAKLGAPALLVPESLDGMGQTMAEVVAVTIELGRQAVPGPFLNSSVAATAVLAALAPSPRRDALLQRAAGGGRLAAVVDGADLRVTKGPGGAWTVDGLAPFVLGGDSADDLIVTTRDAVLAIDAASVNRTAVPMADQTRRLASVTFDHVSTTGENVLGEGEDAAEAVERGRLAFGLALAADSIGGASAALELAVEYAKTRHQFGRAIGSFQAIKHKLADMHVAVESARAITLEAAEAWAMLDEGDPAPAVASLAAAAYATRVYVSVAGDAIQVHGGIGFTWEHPCHRYFKRAWLNQALIGGPAAVREEFAEAALERARSGEQRL